MTRAQSTAVISAYFAMAVRKLYVAPHGVNRPLLDTTRQTRTMFPARCLLFPFLRFRGGAPGAMVRLLASVLVVLVAAAGSAPALAQGLIDEGKLGLIAHDINLGGKHKEPGGDINGELLFVSPGFLSVIGAPRPHLGVSVNDAGATSYAYTGLTWTAEWRHSLFGGLGLGAAVHDGSLNSPEAHHKELGSRALFHESLEFGVRVTKVVSTSLFLDHLSNADLARHNAGLTNFGLRLGVSF